MINRILAVAALLLFCLTAATADAATAISYSEPDNTYGWCAGYSTSAAPGCAKEWCEKSGGTACNLALVCDAGWNALVFADTDEAQGFGAACDFSSANDARVVALASCIVQSNAVCWTDSTFNGEGTEREKSDNGDFDLTWYVQGLLKGQGYDPGDTDGAMGARTRTAIKKFQADMGLEETGEVDEDLFYILLSRNGGTPFLVAGMQSLVDNFTADETAQTFSAASAPAIRASISDEMALRNTAVQRVVFADYLQRNDYDCPTPARTATLVDAAAGTWDITCSNNGSFTIYLSPDGNSDRVADNSAVEAPVEVVPEPEPEPVEVVPPPGKDKGGPVRGKDKG